MTKKETKSNKKATKEKTIEKEHTHKCKCKKHKIARFLFTVIISSVVTASIIITVPLWMGKVLPAEKQPAFLRKALMPITNVKVIATKPLPNEVDKYINNANIELQNKLNASEARIKQEIAEYEKEIISIEDHITRMEEKNNVFDNHWINYSIQNKMFLVTFYNLYDKAMSGQSYYREIELLKMNITSDMEIAKELTWIDSYSKKPPMSLYALGEKTADNSNKIIIESIKATEKGLKAKFLIAINNIMRLDAPTKSYKQGSLKYYLSEFSNATKNNNEYQAMSIGAKLAKTSTWFKNNVMNELEERYIINKNLQKIRANIEKKVYNDAIENVARNMKNISGGN